MDVQQLTEKLKSEIERFFRSVNDKPLSSDVTPTRIREFLHTHFDLQEPASSNTIFEDVVYMLREWNEHSTHTRHFGLFRPSVDISSVLGDALAALYNAQLATWDMSPAGNEIERFTLSAIAARFGYDAERSAANFTVGGSEANHTAVIVALTHLLPEFGAKGLKAIDAQPLVYISEEGHHSFEKIAHSCGIGRDALRFIATDADLQMDMGALQDQYQEDASAGYRPLMVVGTAGTTNAGVIDPLPEIADFCRAQRMWFHTDAAWGGAAALSDRLRPCLRGIDLSDSVTCDAHKWLSVSVGTGMFFCRHKSTVRQAFATNAAYVPTRQDDGRSYNYLETLQWGRRFTGLKLFLMMAELGVSGIAKRLEHQASMGEYLREQLQGNGWLILNKTRLPVVCFSHPRIEEGRLDIETIVETLKRDQAAWVSRTHLQKKRPCLRACIANYLTQKEDIDKLIEGLGAILVQAGTDNGKGRLPETQGVLISGCTHD
jgi:glutamate/tyrosine decarboxylase-like PLP-dependent enzyme